MYQPRDAASLLLGGAFGIVYLVAVFAFLRWFTGGKPSYLAFSAIVALGVGVAKDTQSSFAKTANELRPTTGWRQPD